MYTSVRTMISPFPESTSNQKFSREVEASEPLANLRLTIEKHIVMQAPVQRGAVAIKSLFQWLCRAYKTAFHSHSPCVVMALSSFCPIFL